MAILLPVNAYSEDVCFTESQAASIVVDLERAKIQREELEFQRQSNDELEKQVKLLKEVVALQKEQLKSAQDLNKAQAVAIEQQKQYYEKALKDAKPGFFESVFKAIGYIGVGLILGAALL